MTPCIALVRHALAADAEPGQSDAERALTDEGRKRARKAAKGLCAVVAALPRIAHSPLPRAVESAAILAAAYTPSGTLVELPALAPGGDPEAVFRWLRDHHDGHPWIALVGHEPDLGRWAALALSGAAGDYLPLKKSGVCLLEMPGGLEPGGGRLVAHLPPRLLRDLASRRDD